MAAFELFGQFVILEIESADPGIEVLNSSAPAIPQKIENRIINAKTGF